MKNFLLLSITFLLLTISANADQVITLKDGSQLRGELINVTNGVYTIQTTAMGNVQVNADNVATVSTNGLAKHAEDLPAPTQANFNQKIQQTQNQVMGNPVLLAEIQEMLKDPEIMTLLADPELMRSATTHDVESMSNNPKAKELINNPKVKALMEKIQANSN